MSLHGSSSTLLSSAAPIGYQTGANLYNLIVTKVAAGSFNISVSAVSGTATEAPIINYTVIKSVTA